MIDFFIFRLFFFKEGKEEELWLSIVKGGEGGRADLFFVEGGVEGFDLFWWKRRGGKGEEREGGREGGRKRDRHTVHTSLFLDKVGRDHCTAGQKLRHKVNETRRERGQG